MPVYNDPEIKNIASYVGLREWMYTIRDKSLFSPDYFGIVEFPSKFTAGKNLIKIKAHPNNLVPDSDIHIEILDINGNPIYYEPLKYLQKDYARVIAIWLFPDDPAGVGNVYIAGRALRNADTGLILPYSRDVNNNNYMNIPNVLWKRTIPFSPFEKNSTEIIHLGSPRVFIKEIIQTYQKPINLEDVVQEKSGSGGTVTLKPISIGGTPGIGNIISMTSAAPGKSILSPANVSPVTPIREAPSNSKPLLTPAQLNPIRQTNVSTGKINLVHVPRSGGSRLPPKNQFGQQTGFFIQGANSGRSVPPPFGQMLQRAQIFRSPISSFTPGPTSLAQAVSPAAPTKTGVAEAEFLGYNSFTGLSRMEFAGAFPLSESMEGGTITVVNPNINTDDYISPDGGLNISNDIPFILPFSQQYQATGDKQSVIGVHQLSGSFVFEIVEVETATQMKVQYVSGLNNNADYIGNGDFQIKVAKGIIDESDVADPSSLNNKPTAIDRIAATTNFTSSHIEPYVLGFTEASQSFAEIIVSNMEPATGDVYKMKTQYKPGGMFGDYIDLGDTTVEHTQMLIDPFRMESDQSTGVDYNKIGHFSNLEDFQNYWMTSSFPQEGLAAPIIGNSQPQRELYGLNIATATYQPNRLMSGITLTPSVNGFSSSSRRFTGMHLSGSYHFPLTAGTKYLLNFKAYAEDTLNESEDPKFPFNRVDVYVSGSEITPESGLNTYRNPSRPVYLSEMDNDNDDFDYVNGRLGTKVMSVEIDGSGSMQHNAHCTFRAMEDGFGDVFFIVRRGEWSFSRINLVTHKDTGFSPNYVRKNIRIPTEFLDTPLAFKFNFYDYRGAVAEAEPVAYPVTFQGDNTYMDGANNLITGSLFMGNVIGEGIEFAGANSAYIRSVGFFGYSASLQANRPDAKGGFIIYSGSVLPQEKQHFDNEVYKGVGVEIVADDDSSHFIFGTNPSKLDIKTDTFFLGSDDSFISGSGDGSIAMSSSFFHLETNGSVTMQGQITATAGGTIGGFSIGSDNLSATNFSLNTTDRRITLGSGNDVFIADADEGNWLGHATQDSAPFAVNMQGALTASAGNIAGFIFDEKKLSNEGLHLSSSYGLKVFDTNSENNNFVEMQYHATDNYGLKGSENGNVIFELGSTNQIAGWEFTNAQIRSNSGSNTPSNPGIIINSNGTIETDPFISGLTANATGWQIRGDGRAEFENAVIRGTLSTAVFEKDTISVVGGQVMVANAAKIDNVNPRFTNYPYLLTQNLERINYSGEVLPVTGSNDQNSSLRVVNGTVEANHVGLDNLWLRVANSSAANATARFSINTGSYSPGTAFRLTFYTSGSVSFRVNRVSGGGVSTYVPSFKLDGVSQTAYTSVSEGFHLAEFSSSADYDQYAVFQFRTGTSGVDDDYYLRDLHAMATSQSLTVDNAGGFVNGEILVAKSTDQGPDGREGFVREYMRVVSSSLGSSETPASGTLDLSGGDITTNTILTVTASKNYTFEAAAVETPDQVANNRYYFVVGNTFPQSLVNLKNKIVEEVLDMFIAVTGSQAGIQDQLYFQGVGVGEDGNAYGAHTGSNQITLSGAIPRVKPTLTVERNVDALVSGNERGYFIDRIKDGQSLASQGADKTGYILLNAQPTDDNTPYIDIVERQNLSTGSQQHTGDDAESVFGNVETLVRIGDLSGITDGTFSDDVSGYGIYTKNGYFKGKIEVASLPQAPAADKLLAYYPLDTLGFIDATGLSPGTGSIVGATDPILVSGSIGHPAGAALKSVGTANVNLPATNPELDYAITHGNFSMCFYLTAAVKSENYADLINWNIDNTTQHGSMSTQLRLEHTNDSDTQLNFITSAQGSSATIYPGITLPAEGLEVGETYHIAIVSDISNNLLRYYKNGVSQSADTWTYGDGTIVSFEGSSSFTDLSLYEGNVDGTVLSELRFYTSSLTPNEIEAIYLGNTQQGGGRTIIEGGQIKSGQLESNNFGPSFGSQFDLTNGTFKLGGSDNPNLEFDGSNLIVSGAISASKGQIAGFNIQGNDLFHGTKDTAGFASNNEDITIGSSGIHTKNFFVNTSDGTAGFSGTLTINAEDLPTGIVSGSGQLGGIFATAAGVSGSITSLGDVISGSITSLGDAVSGSITSLSDAVSGSIAISTSGSLGFFASASDATNVSVALADAAVLTNAGGISTNQGNISTNSGNISTNSGNISTNSGNISTNSGNITTATNLGNTAVSTANAAQADATAAIASASGVDNSFCIDFRSFVSESGVTPAPYNPLGASFIGGGITNTNGDGIWRVNQHASETKKSLFIKFDDALTGDMYENANTSVVGGLGFYRHPSMTSNTWRSALIHDQGFLKKTAPTLEIVFRVPDATSTPFNSAGNPANSSGLADNDLHEMIGWFERNDTSKHDHLAYGLYIAGNDLAWRQVSSPQGNLSTIAAIEGGAVYHLKLQLIAGGGCFGQLFKNGDTTNPVDSVHWLASGDPAPGNITIDPYNVTGRFHPGICIYESTHNIADVEYIAMACGTGLAQDTTISGNVIRTGVIASNNFQATAGTIIDLDGEKITFGGSTVGTGATDGILLDGANSNMAFHRSDGTRVILIDDTAVASRPGILMEKNSLLKITNDTMPVSSDDAALQVFQANIQAVSHDAFGAATFAITDGTTEPGGMGSSPTAQKCSYGLTSQCYLNDGSLVGVFAVATATDPQSTLPNGARDAIAIQAAATATATANSNAYSFFGNSGHLFNHETIKTNGDVIAFQSSDKRLKENIVNIESPLQKIKMINGVMFDWKVQEAIDQKRNHHLSDDTVGAEIGLHDTGIIAQEVRKVLPEVVTERPGPEDDPNKGYLAVNYEKLVPLLIEGIKEQQVQIEQMQKRINKLEGGK